MANELQLLSILFQNRLFIIPDKPNSTISGTLLYNMDTFADKLSGRKRK